MFTLEVNPSIEYINSNESDKNLSKCQHNDQGTPSNETISSQNIYLSLVVEFSVGNTDSVASIKEAVTISVIAKRNLNGTRV